MKAVLVLALGAACHALSMPSMSGFNMPSMPSMSGFDFPSTSGSTTSGTPSGMSGFNFPSTSGSTTSGIPSGMSNAMSSMEASMEASMKCIASKCAAPASACQADKKCYPLSGCLKECSHEYEAGSEDYQACEAECGSGLESNQNFQNLMNCEGNCYIEAKVTGFDCLADQCATEWQACQNSATCSAGLSCANTCFGYDICLQDCAHKSTDKALTSLLNCQISCISDEVSSMTSN